MMETPTDPESSDVRHKIYACAREFLRLLHQLPVSSARRQAAIQHLIRAVRVLTTDNPEITTSSQDGHAPRSLAQNRSSAPAPVENDGRPTPTTDAQLHRGIQPWTANID